MILGGWAFFFEALPAEPAEQPKFPTTAPASPIPASLQNRLRFILSFLKKFPSFLKDPILNQFRAGSVTPTKPHFLLVLLKERVGMLSHSQETFNGILRPCRQLLSPTT